jgi:hypothetical protein
MGFKPIFILPGGERGRNAQVFATEEEARESALARFMGWTMPEGIDVEPTNDSVNYRRIDGRDEPLK